MDYPTGLMITAVALFQEVETPLGEVAYFRPDGAPKEGEASESDGERQNMIDSIRQSFEEFEADERERLPEERQQVYIALRRAAQWFEQGRFQEEEEDNG